jgi:hypothetical protein
MIDNPMESINFVNSKLCYLRVGTTKFRIQIFEFYWDSE